MTKNVLLLSLFILVNDVGSVAAVEPKLPKTPAVRVSTQTQLQIARQQADRCQWLKAINSYNKSLAASPKDAICLARRGFAYANMGNLKQAFADFAAAIQIDPKCPDGYSRRSRIYAWLGLKLLAKQDAQKALSLIGAAPHDLHALIEHANLLTSIGKRQQSEEESKRILAAFSSGKDLESLFLAAAANNNLRQFQDEVNNFKESLKIAPDCLDTHLPFGCTYWNLNQWKEAIIELDKYIAYNPQHPVAYWLRADCYSRQGEHNKAFADFDKAIELAPNFASAYYDRGINYSYLEKHQKAVDDFSMAIRLNPTSGIFYGERANSYNSLKDWQNASKDVQKAMVFDAPSIRIHTVQAHTFEGLGDFNKAIDAYGKAIALAPKDSSVYLNRGFCYQSRQKNKEAIADFTETIKNNPKDAVGYCARGCSFVNDHQYQLAIDDCNQSLKLDPSRPWPYLNRGIAFSRLGKYDLALHDLDETIKRCPEWRSAYIERSLVYKSLGKKDLADQDAQKAKELGLNHHH